MIKKSFFSGILSDLPSLFDVRFDLLRGSIGGETVRRANNKVIKRVSLPTRTAWNQSASRLISPSPLGKIYISCHYFCRDSGGPGKQIKAALELETIPLRRKTRRLFLIKSADLGVKNETKRTIVDHRR